MEHALLIAIDRVVAGTNPVAVAVDERVVECQEPECLVDVEHRRESRFELSERCLVERLAELDQRLPVLGVVIRLQAEGSFVIVDVVTDVLQPTASHRTAVDLPPRPLRTRIVLSQKILVELLGTRIDAPALAVDRQLDEVRFRRGNVFPRNVRVQNRVQERRVFVRVEQVQCLVTIEPLLRVHEVKRQVQGPLRSGRDHHERRHATEVDAHVRILHAIDSCRTRNLDIGVVEVGEFRFPIGVLEFEEQRPQDRRLVELGIGHGLHVAGRELRSRLGWFVLAATRRTTTPTRRSATGWPTEEAAKQTTAPSTGTARPAIGLQKLTRCGALCLVQTTVRVLVELRDELPLAPHRSARTTGSAPAGATESGTAWPTELWLGEREALPGEIAPLFLLRLVQHGQRIGLSLLSRLGGNERRKALTDDVTELGFLVIGQFELLGDFRTVQRRDHIALQRELLQPRGLLLIEALVQLLIEQLYRRFGLGPHVGETLVPFLFAERTQLLEIDATEGRSHLLLHLALQVIDLLLLSVGQCEFRLHLGGHREHDVGRRQRARCHRPTKSGRPAEPATSRPARRTILSLHVRWRRQLDDESHDSRNQDRDGNSSQQQFLHVRFPMMPDGRCPFQNDDGRERLTAEK